jgi:transposase
MLPSSPLMAMTLRPRFLLWSAPTDMRKGFDGLAGIVRNGMQRDPLAGDVFVFVNRSRSQIRMLYFDGDGFVLVAKRLERGTFAVAGDSAVTGDSGVDARELRRDELLLMLEGIDRVTTRRRLRYSRE